MRSAGARGPDGCALASLPVRRPRSPPLSRPVHHAPLRPHGPPTLAARTVCAAGAVATDVVVKECARNTVAESSARRVDAVRTGPALGGAACQTAAGEASTGRRRAAVYEPDGTAGCINDTAASRGAPVTMRRRDDGLPASDSLTGRGFRTCPGILGAASSLRALRYPPPRRPLRRSTTAALGVAVVRAVSRQPEAVWAGSGAAREARPAWARLQIGLLLVVQLVALGRMGLAALHRIVRGGARASPLRSVACGGSDGSGSSQPGTQLRVGAEDPARCALSQPARAVQAVDALHRAGKQASVRTQLARLLETHPAHAALLWRMARARWKQSQAARAAKQKGERARHAVAAKERGGVAGRGGYGGAGQGASSLPSLMAVSWPLRVALVCVGSVDVPRLPPTGHRSACPTPHAHHYCRALTQATAHHSSLQESGEKPTVGATRMRGSRRTSAEDRGSCKYVPDTLPAKLLAPSPTPAAPPTYLRPTLAHASRPSPAATAAPLSTPATATAARAQPRRSRYAPAMLLLPLAARARISATASRSSPYAETRTVCSGFSH